MNIMQNTLPPMPLAALRVFSMENRKRHTRRNFLLGLGAVVCFGLFLLVTCAPVSTRAIPPARIVPATLQPSAVPTLEDARRITAAADIHGATAADRVGSAKAGLGQSHAEMQSLVTEVGRLRKQKAASENELMLLYNRLVEQEKKTRMLVIDISDAEAALASERTLRSQVSAKLSEAERLIHAKDAEAVQLRGQLAHAEQVADAYSNAADQNAQLAAAHSAKASKAQGTISILSKFLLAASLAFVLSAIINVIQFRGKLPI